MNIPRLMSSAKKVVSDNSPVILTAIGVTGAITTAYLAGKASWEASRRVQELKELNEKINVNVEVSKRQKFDLVWKLYIPAVTTGTLTCACIIGANYIGTRRAAALAAAYSLSERALSEYKDKVLEKVGEETHREIQKEVAQERLHNDPPRQAVIISSGDALVHDAFTNRYFMSDKETLRRAANDINYEILHSDFATLSDFYKKVGLEGTSTSDEVGWNGENPCELLFAAIEAPDGRPCLSYDFALVPIRAPWVA